MPSARGALLAIALLAAACVPSLHQHATFAESARIPIATARDAIEAKAWADVAEIQATSYDDGEADERVEALRLRYLALEGSLRIVVIAYNAYVDAIKAAEAGGDDVSHEAAQALLLHWRSMFEAARAMGLTMPAPPTELRKLAGQ